MKKDFGCGRPECWASSGICGAATFGTGNLDPYGYWEFPCKECEDAWAINEILNDSKGAFVKITFNYIKPSIYWFKSTSLALYFIKSYNLFKEEDMVIEVIQLEVAKQEVEKSLSNFVNMYTVSLNILNERKNNERTY